MSKVKVKTEKLTTGSDFVSWSYVMSKKFKSDKVMKQIFNGDVTLNHKNDSLTKNGRLVRTMAEKEK